jgi:hypothetical protein
MRVTTFLTMSHLRLASRMLTGLVPTFTFGSTSCSGTGSTHTTASTCTSAGTSYPLFAYQLTSWKPSVNSTSRTQITSQ